MYSSPHIDNSILNKISNKFTSKYFEIPSSNIESTLTKITNYFENNGYTFSTCQLKNITLNKNKLLATLKLSVSKKRNIDNIVIKGYDQFPKKFLNHYLNIKRNKSFNLDLIKRVNSQLKTIPFILQIKEPEILFTKDSTTLYLYLKKQNKNNFNGIIGFSNKKGSSKLQLNGNLNLNLNNTLNKGESLFFRWRNNGNNSQMLNLKLSTPFLFNTPISGSSNFSILKQDSIYSTTSLELSLKYKFKENNFLGFTLNGENSNSFLTNRPTNNFKSYTNTFYGIHYSHNFSSSYFKSHESKFSFNFKAETGNRTTQSSKTTQHKLHLSSNYSIHLNSKSSLFIKNTNKLLITKAPLQNELFRIGGANSIRGFEEQSIFSSQYSIINIEYRYKLNQQAHLHTITDFALTKGILNSTTNKLYAIGIGYLSTIKNNSIHISYCIGNETTETFSLNNSKIIIKFSRFFWKFHNKNTQLLIM